MNFRRRVALVLMTVAIVATLLMAILANGCDLIDVSNYVQEMIVGAVIVVAVALDRYRSR